MLLLLLKLAFALVERDDDICTAKHSDLLIYDTVLLVPLILPKVGVGCCLCIVCVNTFALR